MSYYFPHDCDAMNDDRLLQIRADFGMEGYGLFWACLETMSKNQDGYLIATLIGGLSIGYGVPKKKLDAFLDSCVTIGLFKKDNVGFFSLRMREHLDRVKLLSISGKAGAKKRWKNSLPNSVAIAPPIASDKIRLDKIKEDQIPDSDVEQSSPTPAQEATDFFQDTTKQDQCINFLLAKGIQEKDARSEIEKFVSYWTEPSKNGKKQRWQLEKTFEVRRRLVTWLTNMNKQGGFVGVPKKSGLIISTDMYEKNT